MLILLDFNHVFSKGNAHLEEPKWNKVLILNQFSRNWRLLEGYLLCTKGVWDIFYEEPQVLEIMSLSLAVFCIVCEWADKRKEIGQNQDGFIQPND